MKRVADWFNGMYRHLNLVSEESRYLLCSAISFVASSHYALRTLSPCHPGLKWLIDPFFSRTRYIGDYSESPCHFRPLPALAWDSCIGQDVSTYYVGRIREAHSAPGSVPYIIYCGHPEVIHSLCNTRDLTQSPRNLPPAFTGRVTLSGELVSWLWEVTKSPTA